MNKTELIVAVSEQTGASRSQTALVVEGVFEAITKSLTAGEKVGITGFGSFQVNERRGRTGRNPKTGDSVEIKPRKHPSFKAGKNLKDSVSGNN